MSLGSEADVPTIAYAYTSYSIETAYSDGVVVLAETNDDRDTGYPGVYATWQENYPSVEAALKVTGKSRQGVGHRVFVYLDGEAI
jgi:hypothetical protein